MWVNSMKVSFTSESSLIQLKEQQSGPLDFRKQSFLNVGASQIASYDLWEFVTETLITTAAGARKDF